jgi:hypothetical protein
MVVANIAVYILKVAAYSVFIASAIKYLRS